MGLLKNRMMRMAGEVVSKEMTKQIELMEARLSTIEDNQNELVKASVSIYQLLDWHTTQVYGKTDDDRERPTPLTSMTIENPDGETTKETKPEPKEEEPEEEGDNEREDGI